MNCKFCNAELEAENTVCPVCGKDNAEQVLESAAEESVVSEAAEETVESVEIPMETGETADAPADAAPKKKGNILGIAAACVVLVIALAAALWYGTNDGWAIKEGTWLHTMFTNELTSKASYTADAAEFESKGDKVIATVGGKELTNEQLQVFYWSQFYDFLNYYGSYLPYFGLDHAIPLDSQTCTLSERELTWQQYFLDVSLDAWHRYQLLAIKAEEAGYVMDEEMAAQIAAMPEQLDAIAVNSGYASKDDMIQSEMGPGATIDAYIQYLNLYYYANEYFDGVYNDMMPTDAEVEAYFAENEEDYAASGVTRDTRTVDVRHILLTPEGGTTDESGAVTYSEEEWEACRASAQAILDGWLESGATEEGFAELANANSTDPGSNTNGGLYEGVQQGQMVETFDAWCFDAARVSGDSGLVRTNYGYHIMYFVDSTLLWPVYAQEDLVAERSTAYVEELMAAYPMEVDYKSILIGDLAMFSASAETTPTE